MTALDLIKRSMRLLGALNTGENPTAAEQQDALSALNSLLSAWQTERLTMFTSSRQVFPLAPGRQVYQISFVSGDWIAPRPEYIDQAGLLIAGTDVIERPLRILRTDKEWAHIRVKGVASTIPTTLYYQPDYPSGTVALWPVPTANADVALYSPTALTQITSLTADLGLPPGYERCLAYNLALELAAEFSLTPSQVVVAIAQGSKDSLKRANLKLNKLRADRALRTEGGAWDYLTGEVV
jgi:hypothetical protein